MRVLIVTVFLLSVLNAQNKEAVYGVALLKNHELKTNVKAQKLYQTLNNQIDKVEFSLVFNSKKSLYQIKKKLNVESDKTPFNLAEKIAGTNKILTNKETGFFYKRVEFLSDVFIISDSVLKKWTITKESKLIDGLLCYKALIKTLGEDNKSEINSIAWFSNQIPVPFGPKHYSGLPGLIVELHEERLIYKLKSIKETNKRIKEFKITKTISSKDFNTIVNSKVKEYGFDKKL